QKCIRDRPQRPQRRLGMLTATLGFGLCISIGLSACSSTETGQAGADAGVEAGVAVQADVPKVTLITAGTDAGKLRELRYANTGEQQVTLALSEGFSQNTWQAAAVEPIPAAPDLTSSELVTLSTQATATQAAGGGEDGEGGEDDAPERTVQLSFAQVEYDNLEQASEVRSAEGFGMTWFATSRGQISELSLQAPAAATDTGRAIAEQHLLRLISTQVVFPEEPVGVGAIWTVENRVSGEYSMLQTNTYTISSIEGDVVKLQVDVAQRPSLGALEAADGTTLNVMSSETTSASEITVDLGHPLPIAGQMAYTTRIVYGQEESEARVVQDQTTAVRFNN
ncbi:DUF6263 family protein, partial [Corynebacterium sp. 142RC1]|uniref:DUF6263 family protein n=1 Tax=Corynebacterium sp. 142RC1 TaxID=2968465 RepID=UPI00211CA3A7